MFIVRVLVGESKGKSYSLDPSKKFTVGRDPTSSIIFTDNSVSRFHTEIFKRGKELVIKDLKSTNGVVVNGKKVKEAVLKPGSHIKIGVNLISFDSVAVPLQRNTAHSKEVVDASAAAKQGVDVQFVEEDAWKTTMELKLDPEVEAQHQAEIIDKEIASPNLNTFYKLSQIIATEKDLNLLFKRVLKLVGDATRADNGYLLFQEKTTNKIVVRAGYQQKRGESKISRTIVKRVIQYVRPLLTTDALLDKRLAGSQSVLLSNIKSVICVPMVSIGKHNGVLYLESNKPGTSFSQSDLELATAMALQVGMAVVTLMASEKAKRSLMDTIKILVTTMELKDPKTKGHSERVANYSSALGRELVLSKAELYHIQLAALLHDIGKIALVSRLNISGVSRKDESSAIEREHVQMGEKLLSSTAIFPEILPGIKYHHERVDGKGYPYKLKGNAIPLMARIIAVANIFDNLSNYGGPNNESMPVKDVMAEIDKGRGSLFDNEVVNALFNAYNTGTLFSTHSPFDDYLHR